MIVIQWQDSPLRVNLTEAKTDMQGLQLHWICDDYMSKKFRKYKVSCIADFRRLVLMCYAIGDVLANRTTIDAESDLPIEAL